MHYEVIKHFTDLNDNSHQYKVGDIYPRDGASATSARIKELSSRFNRQRTPLIQAVEDIIDVTADIKDEKSSYTKTDINRMSKDDLVKLASENGIDTTDKSGNDLKKALIEKLV